MTISASQIVSVNPRVIQAGARNLEITGLFLTDNPLCTFPNPLSFTTSRAVGAWFGLNSPEYEIASLYFLGYDSSFSKPRRIHFGRLAIGTFLQASLIGGEAQDQIPSNLALTLTVGGESVTTAPIDLQSATTQSDIANMVAQALNEAFSVPDTPVEESMTEGYASVTLSSSLSAPTGKYAWTCRLYDKTSGSLVKTVSGVVTLTSGPSLSKVISGAQGFIETAPDGQVLTVNVANTANEPVQNFVTGVGEGTAITAPTDEEESAPNSVTVSAAYNSNLNAYILSCDVALGYGTGELADALGLSAGSGAVLSEPSEALTPGANMAAITAHSQNWVSFTTMAEPTAEEAVAFAEWANGTNGNYLYVAWTTSKAALNAAAAENLPALLKDCEGTALVYGGLPYAALVMSIGACIDWNRINGLVTWAFKGQSGLKPTVDNDTDAANAVELNVNYYGKWATRNDDFQYLYPGAMAGGQYGYIDAYIGGLWLRNALQVSLMNGLSQSPRVPYNDSGYTQIRAWCADPINRALQNGVINAGVSISESQRSQLMVETGVDIAQELETNGYYLIVSDPGAQVRVTRDTPVLGLWYTYGGSVHRLELPVTAVL